MNISAFTFFVGLSLCSFLTSCDKGNNLEATGAALLDIKNVSYGSDSAQKMDIYLPANRDTVKTKTVVFIHGGGWNSGDKNEFNEAIAAVRPKMADYAIFNINYRLANNNKNQFPAQTNDIKSALAFIENSAVNYKININKVCLIGASAGAHLALLHAYKSNNDGRIKAVVDLFGPVDLIDMYNNHPIPEQAKPILRNFLGKTPSTDPAIFQEASPLYFVNKNSVPTMIFHGVNDIVVPISQSNALKARLLANNAKVEMTAYAAEGHGWYGKNLQDTYAKVIGFIKENVQ